MVKLVRLTGLSGDVKKAIAELRSNIDYNRIPVDVEVSKIVTKVVFKK